MPDKCESHWYALRVFRNMPRAKADFEKDGVETFIPYQVVESKHKGTRYEKVPLVESLIFVRTSAAYVKAYRNSHIPGVMYYRDLASGEPGAIPDVQMDVFRRVTSPLGSGARYFDNDRPEYHRGERVKILDGNYKGMEGNIFRVGRDRKVLVSIAGVCSLLISDIDPKFLEKTSGEETTN